MHFREPGHGKLDSCCTQSSRKRSFKRFPEPRLCSRGNSLHKHKKKRISCISCEMMIPADTWVLIGLHLKPRYLSRLLRTCKRVNVLVDNNNNWTRVAAHRIWRTCESIEIEDVPSCGDVLPRIDSEHNLLHTIGLDRGYFWTMELSFDVWTTSSSITQHTTS